MIEESSLQGQKKALMQAYEDFVIVPTDYSFIVIDKTAGIDKRYFVCRSGEYIEPFSVVAKEIPVK
jgi:hypothetical protein